ncbi:hypothetical protein A2774_01085 [Candidatus Roizmanbacteria bacterium RIFCSPHIGHO2_01_FULL_39_12c]|uniref:ABC-2 type transporter transmembrane domain-containing protein n=1 Tax=Candidatus Roizmanbacteria bacterium RIFCSPHIGHO2_01_FULL_39_12c TaxID=1802031 RepID=A0A1F7G8M6_9BACT|nr:MAG: hypothetical protein A2774_01085 [Candidatus Roizmanbacteria bacterium RIFCSPHIGHO2_01_FULL_39_12c]OGK46424.1 MAG: hypothetical protein A2963_01495 [Candidatus Roizmanbacteria bacterium RIFCSPLOWO2_01_FULL_40_13]
MFLRVLSASFRAEIIKLFRSPFLIALVMVQAVTFLFLVTLFGLTGAFAPTALIDYDKGPLAKEFVKNLENAHHSFSLMFNYDYKKALEEIRHGNLVAIIMIPQGFSKAIAASRTAPIGVVIDNIDTDMSMDIQRALPSAITDFGRNQGFKEIRVESAEKDLIDHDTDFVTYMVVSALVLAALVISGILSGVAVASEFESKTVEFLAVSPIHPLVVFIGRVLAANIVSVIGLTVAVAVGLIGWGIKPLYPLQMAGVLLVSVFIFGLVGMALGVSMKKAFPVASFIFGVALPLYLFSGTYEPERFDGNLLWAMAHFTPLYYAVGIIEHAVLGLKVTPESVTVNYLALAGWALLALYVSWRLTRKNILS